MPIRDKLRALLLGILTSLDSKNLIQGVSIVYQNGDALLYQFHYVKGQYNFMELVSRFGLKDRWDTPEEAVDQVISSIFHLGRRLDGVAHVTTQSINKRENVLGEGRIWVFNGRVNVSNKAEAVLYGTSQCVALGNAQVTACDNSKVFAFDEVMVHLKDQATVQAFDKAQIARYL